MPYIEHLGTPVDMVNIPFYTSQVVRNGISEPSTVAVELPHLHRRDSTSTFMVTFVAMFAKTRAMLFYFGRNYIPGTQMTSIFEGQPPKTRPFSFNQNKGPHLGSRYVFMCFATGKDLAKL